MCIYILFFPVCDEVHALDIQTDALQMHSMRSQNKYNRRQRKHN